MVLVTGGAGYVGAHICKSLSACGVGVVTFDNLSYGHRDFVKWGPFVKGDLSDTPALRRVFEEFRPSAIMHFAASSYVGESVTDPLKYYRNNVAGAINLLAVAVEFGVKSFVLSSSCATYGIPDSVTITEDNPQNPINPYGETKLVIERMLKSFDEAYGIRSVPLRYFNAAGADPEADIGEDHSPETHLIPLALDAAMGLRDDITVYGTDYETPDGTCVRDFIHVMDLADAHIKALEYLTEGGESTAFNLGSGSGHSVKEILASVKRVTGRDFKVTLGERRPGDPPRLVASSGKAATKLLWEPARGEIDLIVEDAWRWHCKRFGGGGAGPAGAGR